MLKLLIASTSVLLLTAIANAQGWKTDGGETIDTSTPSGARIVGDDPAEFIDALLKERVAADGPGLALAVMRDGELIYAGAAGLADLERGVPVTADTLFDTASVAKSVTAAAIAMLAEHEEFDLDSSVRDWLPELDPIYAPVRVRQLVHHTAGIEDVEGMLALKGWRREDAGTFDDAFGMLAGLQHLRFDPGSQHFYSNGGYMLLAKVVERVTGESLPAFAKAEFFDALELKSARLIQSARELVPNRALPYEVTGGETVLARKTSRYGAGGFVVSVVDLAAWADELRTGEVLGPAVVERMRERGRLATGETLSYAFGIGHEVEAGRQRWGHAGSEPGGQAYFAFYPEHGLSIAAASNTLEGENTSRIASEVVGLLLGPGEATVAGEGPRMMMIPDGQPAPPESVGVEVDADHIASFNGTYEMEDGFLLTVESEGEVLRIGFGEAPSIEIFPLASGRFIMPPANYEFSFEPQEGRATMHITEASVRRSEPHDVVGSRIDLAPLTEETAAELVGIYRSAELNAYYNVAFVGGVLRLVHARHGELALQPSTEDSYNLPIGVLSQLNFRREAGVIVGFDLVAYSWGATSYFERL